MRNRTLLLLLALVPVSAPAQGPGGASFDAFLKPTFADACVKCHGGEKTKGKVDLKAIADTDQLLTNPGLIEDILDAVDAFDMPPEDEPQLSEVDRERLLKSLKALLVESASTAEVAAPLPIQRLNRFQYNNAVRDLFRLNRDVFALPEKLLTRQVNYLAQPPEKMPDEVRVMCLSLDPLRGLEGVEPFPKDLRAAAGFDNQANQLTLSPLLLDTFLDLSVSILESPDFKEGHVGIWREFFVEPAAGTDLEPEVRARLKPFLTEAFRSPVETETLDRYTAYVAGKIESGTAFTEAMKKGAAAALSSPLFLYRYRGESEDDDAFELASRLSFFLWGSAPDAELIRLAEAGELAKPEVLRKSIDRMLKSPKIERFLDSFPTQWMQLENVLAATPDPKLAREFNGDGRRPASTQMVIEPLLLFDTVFVEDRPVIDLIAPDFTYQSAFLQRWYAADLKLPVITAEDVAADNLAKEEKREGFRQEIETARAELKALQQPVRDRLLAARKKEEGDATEPVDLQPVAVWEFADDFQDSVGGLHLTPKGDVRFEDGGLVLKKAVLQSEPLPKELRAKTLEVWFTLPTIKQRGGGLMGIEAGGVFDSIVLGERKAHHWISGSNGFARTEDFPNATPEEDNGEPIHLAMVYAEDGTTTLFRNGEPYGGSFNKNGITFPAGKSTVLFGLRHLPPGGNKHLDCTILGARLYDRALTRAEVVISATGKDDYVSEAELLAALTEGQKTEREAMREAVNKAVEALKRVPRDMDPRKAGEETRRRQSAEMRRLVHEQTFKRVPATDPRYGGIVTNAALATMTSGPDRTHPIARGAWMLEVVFNDPPPPPPNDIPPLNEEDDSHLTIREKFAAHREHEACAGCHARIDPLGFALENFDITGRWRDRYENGRDVDASGSLMRRHAFEGAVQFKESIVKEERRFARALAGHLLRFALARELVPADSLVLDQIIERTEPDGFRLKSLIREVILCEPFVGRRL